MAQGDDRALPKIVKGLRLLPWVQDSKRRDPTFSPIADCENCLKNVNKQSRQSLGCAYEAPPASSIPVSTWEHRGREYRHGEHDDKGIPIVNVCPGYLVSLPEVIDVARAHLHWDKSQLATYCRGEVSDEMFYGVETLYGASGECQAWAMRPAKDGGGGS